ncbi:glucose-6-phosphate isomerase [Candidatus Poriferisocius sp.]|uniref:glucose-6-phosphate isomerase n=1 Tax=Candidatus Poriferisocius sp. TaxID=3101276 RepID=UPI003B021C5F
MRETRQWQALVEHQRALESIHLRDLFAADPTRGPRLTVETDDLLLDFSKNRLIAPTLDLLADLADRAGLRDRIEALFSGEAVNVTEGRAARHVVLRHPEPPPEVRRELDRMAAFVRWVREGPWQAVVNIGIGGSDLGPAMATAALEAFATGSPEVRFLSNVDGAHFLSVTRDLDPARTLFIVSSKTFTTVETMTNARTALAWVGAALGSQAARKQVAAVTANPAEAARMGVAPEATFSLWDWVGGRYSWCSAVGLSLMVAIGPDAFAEMLGGAHWMDEHFRSAPWPANLPALLGLIGVWHRNFWGHATCAVLPYSQELHRFPAYIQQLDMESSGKSVGGDGSPTEFDTGPVVWGGAGTNGQHAFHQLLHQGTTVVPVEFIGFCRPNHHPIQHQDLLEHQRRLAFDHQDLLVANMFAQAEALAFGSSDAGESHRSFAGNRPSSILLADRLTPRTLGMLMALYEHKVFTQATIWGVNPFDQWGVELGKRIAAQLVGELTAPAGNEGGAGEGKSGPNRHLVDRYRSRRGYPRARHCGD